MTSEIPSDKKDGPEPESSKSQGPVRPLPIGAGRQNTSGGIDVMPAIPKSAGAVDSGTQVSLAKESDAPRLRANTAPADLEINDDGFIASKNSGTDKPTSSIISSDEKDSVSSEEEDEELQRAKSMAMAFQNNPKMTPDEIRQLKASKDGIFTAPKASDSVAPLIPGRLTSMMQQTTGSSLSSGSFDLNANKGASFRERARGSFRDIHFPEIHFHEIKFPEINLKEIGSVVSKHLNIPAGEDAPSVASENKNEQPPSVSSASSSKDGGGKKGLSFLTAQIKAVQASAMATRLPPTPVSTDKPAVITVPFPDFKLPFDKSEPATNSDGGSPPAKTQKTFPIRISGIAWKRRGGMGKFSPTSSWERRRIELQGTKLLYYIRDASEEDSASPTDPRDDMMASMNGATISLTDDTQENGVVVTKRANWLEQAASTWVAGSEDPTAPRGYIDLSKEKATVQISFGDSGAPSPFAISIKVRGETKWKLCFDYHKTQMEWLAALTDVVVQNSVDSYNALLLQAADPTYQTDVIMFHPPSVGQPPSRDADGAHRLWMTEPYIVSSCREDSQDNDETNHVPDDMEDDFLADDCPPRKSAEADILYAALPIDITNDTTALAAIEESATKTWIIPEKNVMYVVGVLNTSLAYARASSTTTEGFWYLVVLANLGIYLCLTIVPEWRSCLKLAQGIVGTTKTAAHGSAKVAQPEHKNSVTKTIEKAATVKRKSTGYIPVAGCSTVHVENPTDPPVNSKGEHFAPWRTVPGDALMVRSHGYLTTKEKVASPGELYECVNVDIFESPQRYPDMAHRVKLPKAEFDDAGEQKTWRAPNIFIISLALPTDPPKLGRSTSDGGGYTITMYYRMKQDTRDILKRVTAEGYDPSSEQIDDPQKSKVNAVRLFEEWCRRAPADPKFQSRLKIVPNAHNLKDIGMPSWISKYNGKPFLIKRPGQTGFLFNHPEISCMVFDVSLHPFPYLAKQAICYMKESFFKKILVTFGFVIEGRSDDEVSVPLGPFVRTFDRIIS
jgi:hypothetical protein